MLARLGLLACVLAWLVRVVSVFCQCAEAPHVVWYKAVVLQFKGMTEFEHT